MPIKLLADNNRNTFQLWSPPDISHLGYLPTVCLRANASHVILKSWAYRGPQMSAGDLSLLRPYFEYLFAFAPPVRRIYICFHLKLISQELKSTCDEKANMGRTTIYTYISTLTYIPFSKHQLGKQYLLVYLLVYIL